MPVSDLLDGSSIALHHPCRPMLHDVPSFTEPQYMQLVRRILRSKNILIVTNTFLPAQNRGLSSPPIQATSVDVSSATNPKLSSVFLLCSLVTFLALQGGGCVKHTSEQGPLRLVDARHKKRRDLPWSLQSSIGLVCRQLHNQKQIQDLGILHDYNPQEKDPSHTQLRIAAKQAWDEDKLEIGCKLLNEGKGQKFAARTAGVLLADLMKYWEANYAHSDDDDDDSD